MAYRLTPASVGRVGVGCEPPLSVFALASGVPHWQVAPQVYNFRVDALSPHEVYVEMSADAGVTAETIASAMKPLGLLERIRLIEDTRPGRLVFTTSLGIEDQVLTHAIATVKGRTEIVTLDTGRLFPETYDVWSDTEAVYTIRIRAYAPERRTEEEFVAREGINGFRRSIAARQACCEFRKVEPLSRALAGATAWMTGLRADQSANRSATPLAEVDEQRKLIKVNPLADWTRSEISAYAREHDVPYNVLHDRGFPSIGCAPCTRAVRVGEDERAGRWWWEREDKKECGLHVQLPEANIAPGEEAAAFE